MDGIPRNSCFGPVGGGRMFRAPDGLSGDPVRLGRPGHARRQPPGPVQRRAAARGSALRRSPPSIVLGVLGGSAPSSSTPSHRRQHGLAVSLKPLHGWLTRRIRCNNLHRRSSFSLSSFERRAVPACAVLLAERDQLPVAHAGLTRGVGEQQQPEQTGHLRLLWGRRSSNATTT